MALYGKFNVPVRRGVQHYRGPETDLSRYEKDALGRRDLSLPPSTVQPVTTGPVRLCSNGRDRCLRVGGPRTEVPR